MNTGFVADSRTRENHGAQQCVCVTQPVRVGGCVLASYHSVQIQGPFGLMPRPQNSRYVSVLSGKAPCASVDYIALPTELLSRANFQGSGGHQTTWGAFRAGLQAGALGVWSSDR